MKILLLPAEVPPLQPPFAGLTLPTTVLSPNIYQQVETIIIIGRVIIASTAYHPFWCFHCLN